MSASFCDDCGAILPLPCGSSLVSCNVCKLQVDMADQLGKEVTYVIKFNDLDVYTRGKEQSSDGAAAEASGPVAEKTCPRCGHPEMSYATAQLRSADEGQTIFYTCPKCAYKFSENS
ncbi:DNA-directed RNA polymerase I subunit RPA12-like [Amphibalanus amphitrite]|uniref:DNA-directed RNA polymerase I subunit RPA12-like n=1 Tax=Amphibalanus amphitrite TaxID=1232801 RepID=UPI001C908874|nr:DNA-directed RNA polymerase I subunit RPA12-like [Amphibalanus amphitrite]XP_043200264.1 DNA-directed RNA polymerase I subunit RPA12-like [Amphibalanus amphitrite]XP_043241289.1 DNA-directed RNA polymerase I subunit RPA12-like [Amphibalanus amphitrite]XP_043241290.1 DNA-directed RNA polymerase I subunit RPA12-like [Amphibalanus amphitrite]XP_043241292.1 DNA-directed RNA polymerase I subunit RPA12-like [Amphibalanus amphitrite]XP_043241293.1 DNA-directed RNA polymerase I subunit RPA12-like [